MKKTCAKKNKKGLALSVELIAILTITIGIMSAGVMISNFGYRSYKVSQISKQINSISIAVNEFKNTFDRYPGDLTYTELSGSLNSDILKSNHQKIITKDFPTSESELFISPKTNNISILKSQLSFSQMAKAEILDFKNSENYQISSSCDGIKNLSQNLLPKINGAVNGIWIFVLDSISDENLQTPRHSIIYDSSFYENFKGHPRLIAINQNISDCTVDIENGIGVISSEIAYDLDLKIDDAKPANPSGKVIADAKSGSASCKKLDETASNPTVQNYEYTANSSTKPSESCVLTVKI